MNPLKQLEACGQAPWLDYLKRSLVTSGELATLIERDGLKGMTSNPSIFEKAIAESDEYTDALKKFQSSGDHSVNEIYEHLAIADIRAGADALRPVFDKTEGRDGYISLECSPYLANDTEATVVEALRLWKAVDRPNLMVKVPATPAGLPAIRTLLGRGLNINITLLFSNAVYEQVVEAYIAGLEELAKSGGDVSKSASVASFFVSRIDASVDKRLEKLADKAAASRLQGKVAIANAKMAYARYKALFSGPRWQKLAAAGARTQRLLWASTSTKNPAYRDTMYIEELIGRDTVNTIPPVTMDAFRDHGEVKPDSVEKDEAGAKAVLAELEKQGISLKEITDELVKEGVQSFADSFDKLLGVVAERRRTLADGKDPTLEVRPGAPDLKAAFEAEMEAWRKYGNVRKLWAGDKTLWTGSDEDKWLGWLGVVESERAGLAKLQAFAKEVKQRGFTDVALLGMGGSSLGPEVLAETFGNQPGWPRFHMLDSTDPAQIKALEKAMNIGKTLFIVSSKSGGTLEPNIFMAYFLDRVRAAIGKDRAGENFRGRHRSRLIAREARQGLGFAHIFYGLPSDRRPLLGAVEVRHGAGGGDGHRCRATARDDPADGAGLRPRRTAGGKSRPAAGRCRGRCRHQVRARQGDDPRLAGHRRPGAWLEGSFWPRAQASMAAA
jgi:transaldolase/glucose-6-phosphate isomerase